MNTSIDGLSASQWQRTTAQPDWFTAVTAASRVSLGENRRLMLMTLGLFVTVVYCSVTQLTAAMLRNYASGLDLIALRNESRLTYPKQLMIAQLE